MMSELEAILSVDFQTMMLVNGVAALLGVCLMIVALTSGTEVSETAQRTTAPV